MGSVTREVNMARVQFGGTLATPDAYPPTEFGEKPSAILNGPFIEVLDPLDGRIHTYLFPRVVRDPAMKDEVDKTSEIAVFEVEDTLEGKSSKLVQVLLPKDIIGEGDSMEDIRTEVSQSDDDLDGSFILPERSIKRRRAYVLGNDEGISCGFTAANEKGEPRVGIFQLVPYRAKDGQIQFRAQNAEVTKFFGKNVLPMGKDSTGRDLLMYRPEWKPQRGRHKRELNGNVFSYLVRNVAGEWEAYGQDSILPQVFVGREGRYGLVGGDIVYSQTDQTFRFFMHRFKKIRQDGWRRLVNKRVLQYELMKVKARRREDSTWEFVAIGKEPVISYQQGQKMAGNVPELRPGEKRVIYAVDARRVIKPTQKSSVYEVPLTVADEMIISAYVDGDVLTGEDDWITIFQDVSLAA